jgi:hypothetical protein
MTVLLATIIRYANTREVLLDPAQKLFQEVPLASALSGYEQEAAALKRAGPSIQVPTTGRAAARKQKPASLRLPAAHLRRLAMTMRIGPLRARAYLLHQGALLERVWYSTALPLPPAGIRSLLARALRNSPVGALGALGIHADAIPLRIEERHGARWHTVLLTVRASAVRVGAGQLKPPRGYRPTTQLQARVPGGAHAADVPASPIRCALLVTCLAGEFSAPVSHAPGVWADYWGPHWSEHPDVVYAINHSLEDFTDDEFSDPAAHIFWEPLAQYEVGPGKFLGDEIVSNGPGKAVGSDGILEVVWFVLSHRWGTPAPKFWWRYWGNSPIFAIFVDESEVDSSAWAGYHAFAPTEGIFLWWLVHPAMPFFIVKVPSLATFGSSGSSSWQRNVDTATERASHEFVEAATDPFPFTAWADPLKEPIWENGELGDICAQGSTFPWGKETRISERGVAVDPFWSNDAHACVPDARPKMRITAPASGTTVFWRSGVAFVAEVTDLFEGFPPEERRIRWVDEGEGLLGTGAVLSTSRLKPGLHHVWVEETDVTGGFERTAPVTVNVVARPPSVHIEQPSEGSKFPSNHVVAFRGTATDPAQGDLAATATWFVDGVAVGTGASLLRYEIPTEGEHEVTLKATNEAGLSASATVHVKIGPPIEAATVQITSPPNHSAFKENAPINFTAIGEGSGAEELPPSAYSWTDDIDGELGKGPSITRALSGSECEFRNHHVTVTVKDAKGHEASETIEVTVGGVC